MQNVFSFSNFFLVSPLQIGTDGMKWHKLLTLDFEKNNFFQKFRNGKVTTREKYIFFKNKLNLVYNLRVIFLKFPVKRNSSRAPVGHVSPSGTPGLKTDSPI